MTITVCGKDATSGTEADLAYTILGGVQRGRDILKTNHHHIIEPNRPKGYNLGGKRSLQCESIAIETKAKEKASVTNHNHHQQQASYVRSADFFMAGGTIYVWPGGLGRPLSVVIFVEAGISDKASEPQTQRDACNHALLVTTMTTVNQN